MMGWAVGRLAVVGEESKEISKCGYRIGDLFICVMKYCCHGKEGER